jgi:hypothetical protein
MSRRIKKMDGGIAKYNYALLTKMLLLFIFIPLIPALFYLIFAQVYDLSMPTEILHVGLIMFSLICFSFSIGVYYFAITIEQFVMPEIRKVPEYKPLRIAIRYFHGPISHIGIYMGIVFFLFSPSFFDKFDTKLDLSLEILLIMLFGVFLGLVIAVAQRINMSWVYQIPFFVFYGTLLAGLIILDQINLGNEFTIFNISGIASVYLYFLYKWARLRMGIDQNWYSEKNWKI